MVMLVHLWFAQQSKLFKALPGVGLSQLQSGCSVWEGVRREWGVCLRKDVCCVDTCFTELWSTLGKWGEVGPEHSAWRCPRGSVGDSCGMLSSWHAWHSLSLPEKLVAVINKPAQDWVHYFSSMEGWRAHKAIPSSEDIWTVHYCQRSSPFPEYIYSWLGVHRTYH